MQITLDLDDLMAYGSSILAQPAKLCTLNVSQLTGGRAGAELYRVDLEYRLADGRRQAVPVVLKNTSEHEGRVMRALREVPRAGALPLTIASGGGAVHWFVTPFFQGDHLTFEDEVPRLVIESLARVHAYFVSRVGQLGWMPHLDADDVRHSFAEASRGLDAAQRRQPDALLERAGVQLESVGRDPVILAALDVLPVTLTHGDVHPWNVLRLPAGCAVLIDWGNARIAPPMLDLANLVEIDSENWDTYLSVWESVTGEVMDARLARLGYQWATVMINLQYLPYGAGQWPKDEDAPAGALGMVERLEHAVRALRDLL